MTSSRPPITAFECNSCHAVFHRNMLLLMQFNSTSPELVRCFKEGMFVYPNKDGFVQVSYFLLKIIYPDTKAFRDCWPILEKSQEKDFRRTVCEMMRGFNKEFGDTIQFPEVSLSKLMSPGGDRFAFLMWNLSLLAMAVQTKRDLGCHLLHKPSGSIGPHLAACSANIQKTIIENNVEEIRKMESSIESFMKEFSEMRQSILDRICELKIRIKDIESSNVKDLDEYDLDYSLKQKLLDLNSEEGISILKERISQAEGLREDCYKSLKKSGSVVRDWKRIAETVVNQEVHGHKFVLDGHFLCGQGSPDALTSKHFRAYADMSEDDSQVSLLDHLSVPCEKLKLLKLEIQKTDSQFRLESWERICKEQRQIEIEMSKLEAELDMKVLELSAYCNRERGLPVEDQKSIGSTPTLSASKVICASTPIKNNSIPRPLNEKPANITPFQKSSHADYFSKTLEEMIAKRTLSSSPVKLRVDPTLSHRESTLENLVERFQQLQLRMKKESSALKKDY